MRTVIDGLTYHLDSESDLDQQLLKHGAFEQHIVDTAKRVLPKNGVIADVGANAGLLTLPFAKFASKVLAFEPDRESFSSLCKNVYSNSHLNIECYKVAVQDDQECKSIRLNTRRTGGNRGLSSLETFDRYVVGYEAVEATTIDKCGHVDLIKIDVEGGESRVLEGALNTLRTIKPAVIWECSVIIDEQTQSENTREAFSLLKECGYRQYVILGDSDLRPLPRWKPLNYVDILAVHGGLK